MKPLVIYHGNCADGFSAAWCFHHYRKDGYDFHAGVYGKPPPDVTGRIVYLVDFSYKKGVVQEMCEQAELVVLIDHHKTAIDDLVALTDTGPAVAKDNFAWYVDTDRSGAMLAWDYLFNIDLRTNNTIIPTDPKYKEPPLLLEYIQDRDLWKFKMQRSREISAAVFSYEYTFEQWDKLMLGTSLVSMWAAGEAIERKHRKDIKELLNVCMYYDWIAGYHIPMANMPYTMASDACHILATEWKDGSMFAATYYDTKTHRVFSLRSTPEGMDVAKIAERFGGGGHEHASGFKIFLSDIYEGTWGHDGE